MKVKVSAPMKKTLSAAIAERLPEYSLQLVKYSPAEYERRVDYNSFLHDEDFLPASGKMQALRIDYPAEYYAMPRYITSLDLKKVFKRSDHSFDGFINAFLQEIEI